MHAARCADWCGDGGVEGKRERKKTNKKQTNRKTKRSKRLAISLLGGVRCSFSALGEVRGQQEQTTRGKGDRWQEGSSSLVCSAADGTAANGGGEWGHSGQTGQPDRCSAPPLPLSLSPHSDPQVSVTQPLLHTAANKGQHGLRVVTNSHRHWPLPLSAGCRTALLRRPLGCSRWTLCCGWRTRRARAVRHRLTEAALSQRSGTAIAGLQRGVSLRMTSAPVSVIAGPRAGTVNFLSTSHPRSSMVIRIEIIAGPLRRWTGRCVWRLLSGRNRTAVLPSNRLQSE